MKILVVDDSAATRFILTKMLREVNCDVVHASNGKEGLECLQHNSDITVALVDWNMPVMNGYEMICAVRKDPQYGSVKLMMVTTETEMNQIVRAMEAGADEYLMKPFTKEDIVDKLRIMGIEMEAEAVDS